MLISFIGFTLCFLLRYICKDKKKSFIMETWKKKLFLQKNKDSFWKLGRNDFEGYLFRETNLQNSPKAVIHGRILDSEGISCTLCMEWTVHPYFLDEGSPFGSL